MMMNQFAQPYAKAAFEYAQTHHQLDVWAHRLSMLQTFIEQPKVVRFLTDPKHTAVEQGQICLELLGDLLDDEGQNFIKILAQHRRLLLLPAIRSQFLAFRAAAEQTIPINISSAVPLSDAEKSQWTDLLNQKLNQHVAIEFCVKPELIGGLILCIGDRVIDGSIKGRLNRLRTDLVKVN